MALTVTFLGGCQYFGHRLLLYVECSALMKPLPGCLWALRLQGKAPAGLLLLRSPLWKCPMATWDIIMLECGWQLHPLVHVMALERCHPWHSGPKQLLRWTCPALSARAQQERGEGEAASSGPAAMPQAAPAQQNFSLGRGCSHPCQAAEQGPVSGMEQPSHTRASGWTTGAPSKFLSLWHR